MNTDQNQLIEEESTELNYYMKLSWEGLDRNCYSSPNNEISVYIHRSKVLGSYPGYMRLRLIHNKKYSLLDKLYNTMCDKYTKNCILVNDKFVFMFGLFGFNKVVNEGRYEDHFRYAPLNKGDIIFIENALMKSNIFPDKHTLYYEIKSEYQEWVDFNGESKNDIIQPPIFDVEYELLKVYDDSFKY